MYYKLTDQNLQTYNNFQWEPGEWREIPEENQGGELCTSSFFHCYSHPALAALFNPVHADFNNPRLFEIEVGGRNKDDYGVKFGFTRMKLVKEIELPEITLEQRVEFAIRCTVEVYKEKEWLKWADDWLDNKDRTSKSAYDAAAAAYAAVADYAATAATAAARTAVAGSAVVGSAAAHVVAYYAATAATVATYVGKIDLIKIIESMV